MNDASTRSLGWRFLTGLLILILLGVSPQIWAQKPGDLPSPDILQTSLKPDTYSKSPLGYSTAYRLLQNHYKPVRLRDPRSQSLHKDDTVWLLDPNLHHMMSPPQVDALERYLSSEATLVVSLPKRYAAQQSFTGQELLKTGLLAQGASAAILRLIDGYGDLQRDATPQDTGAWGLDLDVERPQSLHRLPDRWTVLVGDADAAFVIRGERRNGAPIYIVSDSDLFANHRIGYADHALLLETLAEESTHPNGTLYIDEAFHGYLSTYTPLHAALRGDGLWVSVTSLVVLILLLWSLCFAPRTPWRARTVVRHSEHDLAARIGHVLTAYRSPHERVHTFRNLVVQRALGPHVDAHLMQARIEHLERLRQPTHALHTLDQRLQQLPAGASRRAARQLRRDYQQWFAEVRDATR